MTMQLKTYNETLHDEFENLIDDLREKVMRNLKNAKHKYHVNYEITQCLNFTPTPCISVPYYTRKRFQIKACDGHTYYIENDTVSLLSTWCVIVSNKNWPGPPMRENY